ncbi:exonuclease domain-containing protein [Ammoniphilus sp. 3BR4]|uniref:exonuclease domain-containing protein n=1 Tax=Ammoniphilus sp. 3BR4 TaxID=3158265 RepID=UPI003465E7D9
MQRFNQFVHRLLHLTGRASMENEAWRRSLVREAAANQKQLTAPLASLVVAGIDSETTGFSPEHGDEIISLAAVKWSAGERDQKPFHSLIQINSIIPENISQLTGITMEDLELAPRLEEIMPQFFSYIGSSVLLGYYVGHDIKFMNYFLWKKYRSRITHRVLDLYGIMKLIDPSLPPPTFDEACSRFGICNPARHTAIGDALAAVSLWEKAVTELEKQGVYTLEHLYQKLSKIRHTSNS